MTSEVVQVTQDGKVTLITLNRPEARNAINFDLAENLSNAVTDAQDSGCIVITGADPAFSAGLDLRNLGTNKLTDLPRYTDTIANSKVPLIAAVNGPAVTGGFEIALSCDFIVASEQAFFADTHLRVGVYPGPVLVDLPRRIGMAWAREMSLTGNFVDAATAQRIGLANHVLEHDKLLPFTLELANAIADQDPQMVSAMRKDWDENMGLPVDKARDVHYRHSVDGGFRNRTGADIAEKRETVIARSQDQRRKNN